VIQQVLETHLIMLLIGITIIIHLMDTIPVFHSN